MGELTIWRLRAILEEVVEPDTLLCGRRIFATLKRFRYENCPPSVLPSHRARRQMNRIPRRRKSLRWSRTGRPLQNRRKK